MLKVIKLYKIYVPLAKIPLIGMRLRSVKKHHFYELNNTVYMFAKNYDGINYEIHTKIEPSVEVTIFFLFFPVADGSLAPSGRQRKNIVVLLVYIICVPN